MTLLRAGSPQQGSSADDEVSSTQEQRSPLEASAQGNDASPQAAEPTTSTPEPLNLTPSMLEAAQSALRARGYNPGPVDGIMGPKTAAALEAFQHDRDLSVTGNLTAEVAAALGIR
ncbi:MAG: hypothetical protein GVY22_06180 [Gammaproteobacteria bacterium]|jgi:peptidoglycan hydrolase-like protein with peptidoglycan-binding domain|nr:hypothetical protein [Gammaproteobacteria bacterium]